jgi:hypothetical protein
MGYVKWVIFGIFEHSTPVILGKIRDMKQMNSYLRIFFSIFIITATGKDFRKGSKVSLKLKEPWQGFLDNNDFVRGAMEQNLLKLLEASINAQLQIPRILPDPKEGGTLIIY